MKIVQLDKDEWENIEITFSGRTLFIEVAATHPIDFGVLSDSALKAFEADKPFQKVAWFRDQKGPNEFPVSLPSSDGPYWLVLWNGNQPKKAAVAYRFSATGNG